VPELALGPPTIGWLEEALKETEALAEAPAPEAPILYLLGLEEEIVAPEAIRNAAGRASNAELLEVEGAKHEVFMETPDRQAEALTAIDAFLKQSGV